MANPDNAAYFSSPRPKSEDAVRRFKSRHKMDRTEGETLRGCLGHDDLPKESRFSNLAHIQDFKTVHAQDLMNPPRLHGHKTLAHEDETDN